MGKQYADELEQLIERLGGGGTNVFVNWDALTPKYADHIEATMCALGATLVTARADAEVAIEGYTLPDRPPQRGVVVALVDGQLEIEEASQAPRRDAASDPPRESDGERSTETIGLS